MIMKTKLIEGGLSVDDRGKVSFVNGFNFKGIKRFYTVENHIAGFIRAWHGHKKEEKYISVVKGSALVCAVKVTNWKKPSKTVKPKRFVLSTDKPSVLYIPKGYANGFMSLTADAKLMVFSTSTLKESLSDDIRFPAYYWNPWIVELR
jgi:dTDP-4-dehydrorhamnose 3,5-epimerase